MAKDEYKKFYNKNIRVITTEHGYNRLEGILEGETDNQIFLIDLTYRSSAGNHYNSEGIVYKDKIISVFLTQTPEEDSKEK